VRVTQHPGPGQQEAGGDAGFLQALHQRGCLLLLRPGADVLVELILGRLSLVRRIEPPVLRPGRIPQHATEIVPVLVRRDRNREPLVFALTGITPVGRQGGVTIAESLLRAAIDGVLQQGGGVER